MHIDRLRRAGNDTGPEAFLFQNERGRRMSRKRVGTIELLANKYDIKFVMDQVGHADSKMTMDVYNQLQQRAKRERGAAFDRLIRQAREQVYGSTADADGVLDNVLDNEHKTAPKTPKTRPAKRSKKPRNSRGNAPWTPSVLQGGGRSFSVVCSTN